MKVVCPSLIMSSTTPFRHRLALQVLSNRNRLTTAGTQGFTLIELLVVIVILGVLGSVGYQAYVSQIARAYANTAANTATALAKNCAALGVVGDQSQFATLAGSSVDPAQVTLTASTCNAPGTASTITVTVGRTGTTRAATATVTAQGQVTPAPVPTA
jgi:prepilin-type N-terminal cleavage/methylation domain-containing protein